MRDEEAKRAINDLLNHIEAKLVPLIQKKQKKEHEKADKKTVKYKGIEYRSLDELRDAYEGDEFDSATYDRLEEKLQQKQEATAEGKTRADLEAEILSGVIYSLQRELAEIMTPEQKEEFYKFLENERMKKDE